MFTGVFASNSLNTQSIADFGAQRTLGMGGSLTNYINKGTTKGDYVTFSNKQQTPEKKKDNTGKILAGVAAAVAAVGGIAFASKKGVNVLSGVKKAFDKIKSKAPKASKAPKISATGLKDKVANFFSNNKLTSLAKKAGQKIKHH